jgi:hypothetical protein
MDGLVLHSHGESGYNQGIVEYNLLCGSPTAMLGVPLSDMQVRKH